MIIIRCAKRFDTIQREELENLLTISSHEEEVSDIKVNYQAVFTTVVNVRSTT